MGASNTGSSDNGQWNDRELIDKEEVRRRLNLPSVRMVEALMRRRKIPYLQLGHRTVRFSWPKVLAAISRLECRALGGDDRRVG